MQTNEEKQFRFSPQVLIILTVMFLALALPVSMGIYAVQMALTKPAPESTTESNAGDPGTEPLRRTLEDLATERLSDDSWASDRLEIVRISPDPVKEQVRIEALARELEATTLPSPESGGTVKILVSLPREKARKFLQKLGSSEDRPPFPREQTRIWVEIVVKKPQSP